MLDVLRRDDGVLASKRGQRGNALGRRGPQLYAEADVRVMHHHLTHVAVFAQALKHGRECGVGIDFLAGIMYEDAPWDVLGWPAHLAASTRDTVLRVIQG